jgi:predicted metalloprotease with PDZ domain
VVWSYEVRVDPALNLDVEATFRDGLDGPLRVDEDAAPFVEGLDVTRPCTAPCRVRYHVRLANAAAVLRDVDTALAAGGAIFAPPSTWLARPGKVRDHGRYRFRVLHPPNVRFASGVRPSASADSYEADVSALEEASFAAFGALRLLHIAEPATEAAVAAGVLFADDVVARWLRAEVAAISAYFGRAPGDRVMIFVAPGTQAAMRGKTLGEGGASILVRVGTGLDKEGLANDWVVAHELVHVTFPALASRHAWFAEGLASYVEPVARVRKGLLSVEKFWLDLVLGMPQGLPAPGDRGLDGTHEWGRVYWGGELYFLLADIAVREKTGGGHSLDDALRAVAQTGANVEQSWPIERVIDECDRATGTRVFVELYHRFALAPGTEDLGALWRRLGIRRDGSTVNFDNDAPLAAIRTAITAISTPAQSALPSAPKAKPPARLERSSTGLPQSAALSFQ